MVLCFIHKCDTESKYILIEYFFENSESKKPLCKVFWKVCDRHAKLLTQQNVLSKIQVLS